MATSSGRRHLPATPGHAVQILIFFAAEARATHTGTNQQKTRSGPSIGTCPPRIAYDDPAPAEPPTAPQALSPVPAGRPSREFFLYPTAHVRRAFPVLRPRRPHPPHRPNPRRPSHAPPHPTTTTAHTARIPPSVPDPARCPR